MQKYINLTHWLMKNFTHTHTHTHTHTQNKNFYTHISLICYNNDNNNSFFACKKTYFYSSITKITPKLHFKIKIIKV